MSTYVSGAIAAKSLHFKSKKKIKVYQLIIRILKLNHSETEGKCTQIKK